MAPPAAYGARTRPRPGQPKPGMSNGPGAAAGAAGDNCVVADNFLGSESGICRTGSDLFSRNGLAIETRVF
jgi:hypothetical protein